MKVVLTGQLGPQEEARWRAELAAALPAVTWLDPAQARAQAAQVEAAVVANPPPGALQGLPALRLIQSLWAGVDRVLADATLPQDVPLARMVDPAMNVAMAETALWAVLSLHRGFFAYQQQQRQGVWRQLPQRRADEVKVGVLGFGQMGRTVARTVAAQGYAVQAWRLHEAPVAPEKGVAVLAGEHGLRALCADAQVVINLLPLTERTRRLLDARFFASLPAGASVVNLARGAHLVDEDLLAALDAGHLAHAVLDVFATEPLPAGHRFWSHPAVTILPHAAALTDPRSASAVVAANLRALREDRPLAHLVRRDRGY